MLIQFVGPLLLVHFYTFSIGVICYLDYFLFQVGCGN